MSVPPYICGAIGLYIFAISSDRQYEISYIYGAKLLNSNKFCSKERGYHILAGLTICLVGLIVTVTVTHNGGRYAGLCVLTFGSYVSAPLTAAWLSGNTPGTRSELFVAVYLILLTFRPKSLGSGRWF